jgi:hypothetical protein
MQQNNNRGNHSNRDDMLAVTKSTMLMRVVSVYEKYTHAHARFKEPTA